MEAVVSSNTTVAISTVPSTNTLSTSSSSSSCSTTTNCLTILQVPAQTDSQYSLLSSNQCSWCAVEFAIRRIEIITAWFSNKQDEVLRLYNESLAVASNLRKEAVAPTNPKTFLYGENIDSANLLNHYKDKINITEQYTILLHEDPDFLDILHPDLRSEFYGRKYSTSLTINQLLSRMKKNDYLLLSRHGQSLCILRTENDMYLILDSHLHDAKLATKEMAMKHSLMDNGGHTHVTLLTGT